MSSVLASVRAQLRAFLSGSALPPLRSAVLEAAETIDHDASLSDDEREWFDELYDAVVMAAEDPVSPRDRKAGVVGATELREQLRQARLDDG